MPTYDQSSGECLVFTFKEGLLSPVAHDLKIGVRRFEVTVSEDGPSVEAIFDPASLETICAMRDGTPSASTLSRKDKKKVDDSIRSDVLRPRKHREIRFASTSIERSGDTYVVDGKLTLGGRTRQVTATVSRDGSRLATEVTIHQPDYGIKPFTALLGTMKVKADVKVHLSIPAPEGA